MVALLMGFSCGLPLLLTISVLQAWMKDEGVDLGVIGLMALVGLPYTLKFLWAPVLDRFTLSLFGRPLLGRRRGWLLVMQIALMLSISGLGFTRPMESPWMVAFVAFFVTFFSASQDIVVDAYRREDLADEELGLGSSLYVGGYRVGMLVTSGGGLILADQISFTWVYQIMAAGMLVGIVTTLFAHEPRLVEGTPRSLKEAVIAPFADYFARKEAWVILAFILLYKLGDTMASAMTIPFYLDLGFSKTEIGSVVKLFGFWMTIAGSVLGGLMILSLGIYRSLWVFGFLQAISTAGFVLLAQLGYNLLGLAGVIAFENLSSGMGASAYVAFMASLTNRKFTATQYALLTGLMGVPRVLASAPTGYLAEIMGWMGFFTLCTLIAIPGLLLLLRFSHMQADGRDTSRAMDPYSKQP